MEEQIVRLIEKKGPLTGGEIWEAVGGDGLEVWRTCRLSPSLEIRRVGTRYLRLDRRVEGFARLSPSIWREFLTYSVVGLRGGPFLIDERARDLIAHIEDVSSSKAKLAYQTVSGLAVNFDMELSLAQEACFIIAGDIVYNMAHDVPRPERSTGKLVNGSDMDIVVVVDDEVSDHFVKSLDHAIYKEKYRLLITPHMREEIDYVVKRIVRIREQVRFDTFKHMVACKILYEGTFLYGNEEIFHRIKKLLRRSGIAERLMEMEHRAKEFREEAEAYLLRHDPAKIWQDSLYLFYPSEESEEFE